MIRLFLALAALAVSFPAIAQSEQEALQSRYDRALAAGYKALMLCGGIGNADPTGLRRSAASVEAWELEDIQEPQAAMIRELPAQIAFGADRFLDYVAVPFATDMPPRVALFKGEGKGCAIQPIGAPAPTTETPSTMPIDTVVPPGSPRPQPPQTRGTWADLARTAFTPAYGEKARTTAVLIQQRGRILGEAYAPGFDGNLPQRTWSVAKSLAATLVGAAVQRGDIPLPILDSGHGDAHPVDEIGINRLLRMASGRYSSTPGNRTDPLYFGGSTVRETALDLLSVHRPGTVFRYANNDTLAAVIAISPTFEKHPPRAFLDALGMRGTVAETDHAGDYVLSSQVWASARDLARLGQLYVQRGRWNGAQLIPADWLAYVSQPSGPQPKGDFGYGAGFWLFNKSHGVPADTIAMQGNRGQYVVIVPSRDVVIVRRGEDGVGARFEIAGFTRDVLSKLPG